MMKLRKIIKYFQSVLLLKRNNGQKRALNILRGVRPHPMHPLRYATGKVLYFVGKRIVHKRRMVKSTDVIKKRFIKVILFSEIIVDTFQ